MVYVWGVPVHGRAKLALMRTHLWQWRKDAQAWSSLCGDHWHVGEMRHVTNGEHAMKPCAQCAEKARQHKLARME